MLYEYRLKSGAQFRNTGYFVFEGDRIKEVQVFFGDPPSGVAKKDYQYFLEQAQRHRKERV